jgi:hypothetical protein
MVVGPFLKSGVSIEHETVTSGFARHPAKLAKIPRTFSRISKMPETAPKTLSPTALSLEDAATLLTRIGGAPVTVEMLEADIDAGAPVNDDRTINLVHYAAWLVHQMANVD